MKFADYAAEFSIALNDEIKELQKQRGRKIFVTDGRRLGKCDGRYLYSLTADSELRFPDRTPTHLELKGRKIPGLILSVEGFEIVLGLEENLGDAIPMAVLCAEPWFLLEKLKERLTESKFLSTANRTLAEQLLSHKAPAAKSDPIVTEKTLEQIGLSVEKNCNEYQVQAVDLVLNNRVTFIWGPPGTGKTKTLGMTVGALVRSGQSVLIVAHSNSAVDIAMQSAAGILRESPQYQSGKILRYGMLDPGAFAEFPQVSVREIIRRSNPSLIEGIERLERDKRHLTQRSRHHKSPSSASQEIASELDSVRKKLQLLKQRLEEAENTLLFQAQVIGCTLSKATLAPQIYNRRFDAVIVDEASMAYIPHCAFVSTLAFQRIALFGDFKQLAPISQGQTEATAYWLARDIFEEAGIASKVNLNQTDPRLILLKTQYRMHPDIGAIASDLFYGGQLSTASGIGEKTSCIVDSEPAPGRALVLYDFSPLPATCTTDIQSQSRFNPLSALLSLDIARQIARQQQSVGVITPYIAQSRLLNRLLKDTGLSELPIQVATVHKFQGSERNAIVFDGVDSAPKTKAGKLLAGGADSTAMRLANVAISRARGKFAGVVNYAFICDKLPDNASFRRLITRIKLRGEFQPVKDLSRETLQLPGVSYFSSSRDARDAIEADLSLAREEVAIAWFGRLADCHFDPAILEQANLSPVRFFISSSCYLDFAELKLTNLRQYDLKSPVKVGLVGIDRRCLWIYLNPTSASGAVLRLNLKETVKLLYTLYGLIPADDLKQDTLQDKVASGKSLLGNRCQKCLQNSLWLAEGKYGAHLACQSRGCNYTKKLSVQDVNVLIQIMNVKCQESGCCGQLKARKRASDSSIFLGCTNYPKCKGTKRLESIM